MLNQEFELIYMDKEENITFDKNVRWKLLCGLCTYM